MPPDHRARARVADRSNLRTYAQLIDNATDSVVAAVESTSRRRLLSPGVLDDVAAADQAAAMSSAASPARPDGGRARRRVQASGMMPMECRHARLILNVYMRMRVNVSSHLTPHLRTGARAQLAIDAPPDHRAQHHHHL